MGYELNKLMQQFGVTSPTLPTYFGSNEQERAAYDNYTREYRDRLATTPMYGEQQYQTSLSPAATPQRGVLNSPVFTRQPTAIPTLPTLPTVTGGGPVTPAPTPVNPTPPIDFSGIYDRFGRIEDQLRRLPDTVTPDLTGIYDRFGQIEDRISGIPQYREPDLTGIYDRFGQIEDRISGIPQAVEPDLTGIYDRFGEIENRLQNLPTPQAPQAPDLTGIYDRFGSIENQLRNIPTTDLTGIYDRFGQIENRISGIPQFQEPDLSGIYDRFGQIENRLQNLPTPQTPDLAGIYDRFSNIENQLRGMPTYQEPDLTGLYDRFGQIENRLQNIPTPQTQDLTGLYDRFGQLESRINSLPTPQAQDLTGLYDRFGQLESRINSLPTPQAPDLSGIYDRFGQLENRFNNLPTPQAQDLSGIYDRFGQLEGRISNLPTPQATDLSGIQAQIEALRGQYQPTDLSGIQSQIGTLSERINSLPAPQATDLSGIYDRFGQLEGRINNLPAPQATDLSGVYNRFGQLENRLNNLPTTDLSGIQSQIGTLSDRLNNLPTPQATDLSGVYDRFGQLEGRINSLPTPQATDLSGVYERLGQLDSRFSNLPAPQATDLSGVYERLGQLDSRFNNLPTPQATDLSGIYDRFGQLEGRISNLPTPQATDLSGLQNQIEALRSQVGGMPTFQATDLSGLQNQISGLQNQINSIPFPQATDLSGITAQLNALQELYSNLANNSVSPTISGGEQYGSYGGMNFYARGGPVKKFAVGGLNDMAEEYGVSDDYGIKMLPGAEVYGYDPRPKTGPLGSWIEQVGVETVPGVVVAGRARTPERNREVGGVADSLHLTDNAVDFRPPPNMTQGQLLAKLKAEFGSDFDVLRSKGRSVHVEPGPGITNSSKAEAAAPATELGNLTPPAAPGAGPISGSSELKMLLDSYGGGESVYAEELASAREKASKEADAFRSMLEASLESPEDAKASKAEMYFRLAAAFGSPTKTGGFGENLGLASKEMAEYSKGKREASQSKLATRLKLQEMRMGAAKEELGTLRALSAEEMKDRRVMSQALIKEYIDSGKPQSAAGKQALDEGYKAGTPEFQARVRELSALDVARETAQIEALIGNLAINTQREEREAGKSEKLTPQELTMKRETEDSLASLTAAMGLISDAYTLNPNTFDTSLPDMARRKALEIAGSKDPKLVNTRALENKLKSQVITSAAEKMKGVLTDSDIALLKDIEGLDAKSVEERAIILRSAYTMLKTARTRMQQRLQDVSSGAYRQISGE